MREPLLPGVSLNLWHSGDLNPWPEWEMANGNLTFSNVSSVCYTLHSSLILHRRSSFYSVGTENKT